MHSLLSCGLLQSVSSAFKITIEANFFDKMFSHVNFSVNLSQSVSEEPLAQSQGSVSSQHGERGPALPG